jgi:hypothetical protein
VLWAAGLNQENDVEIVNIPKGTSSQKSQLEEAGEMLKRIFGGVRSTWCFLKMSQ